MEMQMDFLRRLPAPDELKQQFPISAQTAELKERRDKELCRIFEGSDDRLLLIIGPCSADHEDAVIDYIARLRKVQDAVSDKIFIVPRIYTNKPRTIGVGYKGMLHQPDPEKKSDMLKGIIAIRQLHMRAANETGFTCADEMLYPENHRYLSDLLSYVAVGARSSRHEKPDQRRPYGYDELHYRGAVQPYVPLPRMGSKDRRQPLHPRHFARLCGQVRPQYPQLPL